MGLAFYMSKKILYTYVYYIGITNANNKSYNDSCLKG